jgi:hypothetical protein
MFLLLRRGGDDGIDSSTGGVNSTFSGVGRLEVIEGVIACKCMPTTVMMVGSEQKE